MEHVAHSVLVSRISADACGLRRFCLETAVLAVKSLHAELILYPKPGLVSLCDSGSHDDMDAALFMRSLFSLRHYFKRMVQAGAHNAPFASLKEAGMSAERSMLTATRGINTHRGAIFSLGLLCAAAGRCHALALPLSAHTIRSCLIRHWGEALAAHSVSAAKATNGMRAAGLYAIDGARGEGMRGFPSVFEIALPQLQKSLARGSSQSNAQIDALFSLMAHMADSNIYHRGGQEGAALVRQAARRFMSLGGTAHPEWRETALECHRLFVSRRLSPGGAADLLAASWFVHQITECNE